MSSCHDGTVREKLGGRGRLWRGEGSMGICPFCMENSLWDPLRDAGLLIKHRLCLWSAALRERQDVDTRTIKRTHADTVHFPTECVQPCGRKRRDSWFLQIP